MCLQWCHVRDMLIDNDLPCKAQCPASVRLAHAQKRCNTCRHYQDGLCALTHEIVPLAETCCHWNAFPRSGTVTLRLGQTVSPVLLALHGAASVREIFDIVDTAPVLPKGTPEDGFPVHIERDLAVPLVYGVTALDWDAALYGGDEEYKEAFL